MFNTKQGERLMTAINKRWAQRWVTAAAAVAAAAWTTAPGASAATGFVGKPVVVYHHAHGTLYFETFVRLTSAAPTKSNGSIAAGATVNDFGPDLDFANGSDTTGGFTRSGRSAAHCYLQSTFNLLTKPPASLRSPRSGQLVNVKVIRKGQSTLKASARLMPGGSAANKAVAALRCSK
jgi:hypothetical protein